MKLSPDRHLLAARIIQAECVLERMKAKTDGRFLSYVERKQEMEQSQQLLGIAHAMYVDASKYTNTIPDCRHISDILNVDPHVTSLTGEPAV